MSKADLHAVVVISAIVGPELDERIRGYEDGTLEFNKADVLRDLKAATNLARMLALAADDTL